MRTQPVICALIAAGAVSIALPSMAEPDGQSEPTALTGFDIVATKKTTPVSGVDVVAKRATKVSELEVSVPLCPKAKAATEPTDGSKTGNNIVEGKGRFGDEPPPRVVSTFPAKGDVVRPGLLVFRVTFDRPMTCVGLVQNRVPLPDPCPPPLHAPMISHDKRTFLTVCKVEANRQYGVLLSNFAGRNGQAPKPYELVFDTSGLSDVATVDEAVAQDKWLRKVSNPGS
jgi:hypothetical protein